MNAARLAGSAVTEEPAAGAQRAQSSLSAVKKADR